MSSTLPDIDTLRAALTWAASDVGDPVHLVALVGAASGFWRPANLTSEGLRWTQIATERITADTRADIEARLWLGYAVMAHQLEASKEMAALHRAVSLYRSIDDRRGLYESLTMPAQKHIWRHDLPAAERAITEASDLYDPSWPAVMREGLLTARTYWLEVSGRPAEGQALMEELVALMRAVGDERRLDHALMQLAESLFVQGKATEAIVVRREVAERIGPRRVNYAASNLANLCAALTFNDELDEALQTARLAFPLLQHEGSLSTYADHFALLAAHVACGGRGGRRADGHGPAIAFIGDQSGAAEIIGRTALLFGPACAAQSHHA